jgi:hypothetical protein
MNTSTRNFTKSFTALDLAQEKAEKEDKIFFYHDYGNNYDIDSMYDYFVFHKFTTIENLCKELYDYCVEKSDCSPRESLNYEFPDHLNNEEFLIILDGWKNINVSHFPDNLIVSEHEDQIMEYFKNYNQ